MSSILEILNKLGRLYHSYFGFHNLHPEYTDGFIDEDYIEEILFSNKYNIDILNNFHKKEIEIVDIEKQKHLKISDKIKLNQDYSVLHDYNEIIKESETILPYKKIIIKFTDKNYWIKKPNEWYNEPSKWWKNCTKFKKYALPYLCSRNYINVKIPFMKVEVSSEEKGCSLTINDILFATRGLMCDDTRTIDEGYVILKESEDILKLEPKIDNWSS